MERLQKILARAGLASRRHAEQLILSGRVRVNGVVVTELGSRADPANDKVEVDGKRVVAESPVYLILHKPRGVVSTASDPEGRPTVTSLVESVGARVYPVGRLDFQTSGALVLTNDGDFAAGLLHPKRKVPKDYLVKVEGEMQDKDLDGWRRGIALEDGMTQPAVVNVARREAGLTWIEVTLFEGRNQQIRRMGEASHFPVQRLTRLAFAGIGIDGLHAGQWRLLTPDELKKLREDFGVPKRIRSANQQNDSSPQAPSRRDYAKRGGLPSRPWQSQASRDRDSSSDASDETIERPRLPIQRVEKKEGRKVRTAQGGPAIDQEPRQQSTDGVNQHRGDFKERGDESKPQHGPKHHADRTRSAFDDRSDDRKRRPSFKDRSDEKQRHAFKAHGEQKSGGEFKGHGEEATQQKSGRDTRDTRDSHSDSSDKRFKGKSEGKEHHRAHEDDKKPTKHDKKGASPARRDDDAKGGRHKLSEKKKFSGKSKSSDKRPSIKTSARKPR